MPVAPNLIAPSQIQETRPPHRYASTMPLPQRNRPQKDSEPTGFLCWLQGEDWVSLKNCLERSDQFFRDTQSSPGPQTKKASFCRKPFEYRWSQRADSRMPSASAATRPAAAVRSHARLQAGHRPACLTPRDLIGSNPPSRTNKKGLLCRKPLEYRWSQRADSNR